MESPLFAILFLAFWENLISVNEDTVLAHGKVFKNLQKMKGFLELYMQQCWPGPLSSLARKCQKT